MPIGTAGQLPDNLSAYMKDGRSQKPGPGAGNVECLSLYMNGLVTNGDAVQERGVMYVPGGFTLLAVVFRARAVNSSPTIGVQARENPYDGTGNLVMSGITELTTTPTVRRASDFTLNTINADDPRDWLVVVSSVMTADYTDTSVDVFFVRHGHVNPDAVDD